MGSVEKENNKVARKHMKYTEWETATGNRDQQKETKREVYKEGSRTKLGNRETKTMREPLVMQF